MMRFAALFPLVLSIIGFVLTLLCLLAGRDVGYMEDYHIVALNTSTLGQNLLNASTTTSGSTPTSTSSSFGSLISAITGDIDNITSSIESELDSIANDIANELAKELGIKEWYSLHMTDMCEGSYSPNATAKGATYNTTDCTKPVAMFHFNPTATIQEQLSIGGLNITLADIGYPSDIQKGIKELNTALDATFVLYCIAVAATGFAIIGAALVLFIWGSRLLSFGNWGLTSIASTALTIASSIVTVAQSKLVNEVNSNGNDIGLYAYKGSKFLGLTWAAAVMMMLASAYWVVEFFLGRMKQKRTFSAEKPTHG